MQRPHSEAERCSHRARPRPRASPPPLKVIQRTDVSPFRISSIIFFFISGPVPPLALGQLRLVRLRPLVASMRRQYRDY